jgi:hypothetical protein
MGDNTPAGPEQRESVSLDLGKAEKIRVELKMPVGELNVRGGSEKLLEADFTYAGAAWKPEVRYNATTPIADLVVEQRGPSASRGNARNRWDMRFNEKITMDLRIELGAGEGRLEIGVGEATVYLPKDVGISAEVSGGLGDISVQGLEKKGDRYVNEAYGRAARQIRLEITGGVGSIKLIAE